MKVKLSVVVDIEADSKFPHRCAKSDGISKPSCSFLCISNAWIESGYCKLFKTDLEREYENHYNYRWSEHKEIVHYARCDQCLTSVTKPTKSPV